jgi:hypothetical protein
MNYIKRLQSERSEQLESAKAISTDLQYMLEYLASSKFHVDTTVQVYDILHLIPPIRNSVSALAQSLTTNNVL